MNLNEWRKARITEITLPSGLVIQARRVSLLDLAATGQIPNTLFGLLQNLDGGKIGKNELTPEMLAQLNPLLDTLALSCIQSPAIARDAGDETLGVNELPFEDKLALFQWTNEEAARLAPFRQKPGGAVGTARDRDDLSRQAEPTAGTG